MKPEKKNWLSIKERGYITLLSGFIWMAVPGSNIMVGPLSSFILSYFPESRTNEVHQLYPSITSVSIFANFVGG